jgi:hypothetical protein
MVNITFQDKLSRAVMDANSGGCQSLKFVKPDLG